MFNALHHRSSKTVPSVYPVDEDMIRLCMVDHLSRLGCAEHFAAEIGSVMERAYRYFSSPPILGGRSILRERSQDSKYIIIIHNIGEEVHVHSLISIYIYIIIF